MSEMATQKSTLATARENVIIWEPEQVAVRQRLHKALKNIASLTWEAIGKKLASADRETVSREIVYHISIEGGDKSLDSGVDSLMDVASSLMGSWFNQGISELDKDLQKVSFANTMSWGEFVDGTYRSFNFDGKDPAAFLKRSKFLSAIVVTLRPQDGLSPNSFASATMHFYDGTQLTLFP